MNPFKLKIWLLEHGIKQSHIAKELNVSKTLVWMTLNNRANNKKIINWLIKNRCPREFFEAVKLKSIQ